MLTVFSDLIALVRYPQSEKNTKESEGADEADNFKRHVAASDRRARGMNIRQFFENMISLREGGSI
jgi:hypothetical protein